MLDNRDGLVVFTDGSAWTKDRSGGWAWVAIDHRDFLFSKHGWASDTTISRMELTAAIEALTHIGTTCGPSDILVYSDSEYVVLGCQNRSRARNKNVDLWDALDDAIDLHDEVQWMHVRGHADDPLNNLADKLAGEARKKGQAYSDSTNSQSQRILGSGRTLSS